MATWRIPHRTRKAGRLPVQLLQAEVVVYTLSVSDGASASAGDTLDLVQEHNLVTADAVVKSAGDVLNLSEEANLTVADGASVSAVDAVDLIQEHLLVSTDGASVSVGESIALLQEHSLVISDGAGASVGDVNQLLQEHNLSVSDAVVVSAGDVVTISESGTITLTQHSFRFRNDNGDEDAATWAAALNGNFNIAPDNVIRIRFLLDAQGDNEASQFRLEYKKTTDVEWLVAA